MKKFFNKLKKINELWLRYRKWSEGNIIGALTIGIGKAIFISGIVLLIIYGLYNILENKPTQVSQNKSSISTPKNKDCNVATIDINGGITTTPEGYYDISVDDVIDLLKIAEDNNDIKGILIRIDSSGGTPVGSQIVMDAVKRTQKPIVSLIREYGNSGAYLVASAADIIIASPMSDVGSIGVTVSYLEKIEENAKNGLQFIELVAGRFKNAGNPDKKLTNEERALFQRDLDIVHQQMIATIAKNRKMSIEKVRQLADGSTSPGILAIKQGLIDQLGDQETAREWFAKQIDEDINEIGFCDPVKSSENNE